MAFGEDEEFLPGGAVQLVKDGIMDKIDYMFAIHVDAENPVGTIEKRMEQSETGKTASVAASKTQALSKEEN